jgi:AcrR family transcriptional regulator
MSVRKMVSRQAICDAAMRIVETEGVESLSMRALAKSLGIKAPSLYDHVKNRDEVIALVQSAGLEEFGYGFDQAGPSPREKIWFYRSWALGNSNLYPVVFQQRLHRDLLPKGLEEKILAIVILAAGGSHIQARAIWAQLHGLVDLELQGRLPPDADMNATWEQVITTIESVQQKKARRKP